MEDPGPEIHIGATNGHNLSTDCWCEPAKIVWMKNKHGVNVFVVEHENYTQKHRMVQLAERAAGVPSNHVWITRILGFAQDYPTAAHRDIPRKQLPPHEGDF